MGWSGAPRRQGPYSPRFARFASKLPAGKCSPRCCVSRATDARYQCQELSSAEVLYMFSYSPPLSVMCPPLVTSLGHPRQGPHLTLIFSVVK